MSAGADWWDFLRFRQFEWLSKLMTLFGTIHVPGRIQREDIDTVGEHIWLSTIPVILQFPQIAVQTSMLLILLRRVSFLIKRENINKGDQHIHYERYAC